VDFAVYNRSAQPPVETHTSVLLFRPDSTTGTVRP